MSVELKVGDKAVYPAHGVGEVLGIERKIIGGQKQAFYVLRILENNMKIMIPKKSVHDVGIRGLISKREVDDVYDVLRKKVKVSSNQIWNRRYREYMEKIKTGEVDKIASVLRDLCLLKLEKELSFGERKMLDTARNLLIKELALATAQTEEKIQKKIDSFFVN